MDYSQPGSFVPGDSPGKNTGESCVGLYRHRWYSQYFHEHSLTMLLSSYILYHSIPPSKKGSGSLCALYVYVKISNRITVENTSLKFLASGHPCWQDLEGLYSENDYFSIYRHPLSMGKEPE